MFVAKIFMKNRETGKFELKNVAHFNTYEHALSECTDKNSELYDDSFRTYLEENGIDLRCPLLMYPSKDDTGCGVDLELRYGELRICIGQPYIFDAHSLSF